MALPSPKDILKTIKGKLHENKIRKQQMKELRAKTPEQAVADAFTFDPNHPAAVEERQRILDEQQAANPFQIIEGSTQQKEAKEAVEREWAENAAKGNYQEIPKQVLKESPGNQQVNVPPQILKEIPKGPEMEDEGMGM